MEEAKGYSMLPRTTDAQVLMEMRGVSKSFPGVSALDDVSLDIHSGEVHVLLGQNGAGKSTLIKVLCGAYRSDRGEFLFHGQPVRIKSTSDARRLGIAVIFQEFSLVPSLSVAQNIFLGREFPGKIPGTIDHRRMHAEARRILKSLSVDLDTRIPIRRLGVAQQQIVEIAKALSQNARILVMDEPTAALSDREIDALFNRIHKLKQDGIAIIYISHRLREVFAIGDRITVLRDGRKVATLKPKETSVDALVRMMVGREIEIAGRRRNGTPGETVLEVHNLHATNGLRGANLYVRAGEIVGLAGLVGAGRTELARAVFGADELLQGEVRLGATKVKGGPSASVRSGVGLVPENRKTEGLALIRSVQDNLLAASLRRLFPRGAFTLAKAERVVAEIIRRLRVATPSPHQQVKLLSGGNQQKVVIGKWLGAGSRLFIFDEPTRGIDVGAKAEIFNLIEELVSQGAGVLMVSSELPEIVAMCDRAYVMRDKTIVAEIPRNELTEENILRLAMHHA
jgi:ribose transport system ATP-binding protein